MMPGHGRCRSRKRLATLLLIEFACALLVVFVSNLGAQTSTGIQLTLRKRVETSQGSGRFHILTHQESWDPSQTAVIVCDMWDYHHCLNAVRRLEQFAPRLDKVLAAARDKGVTIIHAPSSCMAAYSDHPARKRAIETPAASELPTDINSWCHQIPAEEQGKYPIDQTDGGEDDDPQEHQRWAAELKAMGRNPNAPWQKQTELLTIDADRDYISDRGDEIWSVLQAREIENVILVGVHTNMCVLGRPFGLRQLAKNGKHVVLMRDMTDTMYNPKRWPHVSHFSGTDLIIEHIEKYVCPTITSDQLMDGHPFRFPDDTRPHLVIVMAEDEYRTNQTLPEFAARELNKDFRVSLVFANDSDRNHIPGLEILDEADVALLSIRRRVLKPEQMKVVQRYVKSGKPVIGLRTSSHAFALREPTIPEGYVDWREWDAEIFGGNYSGHYGNQQTATIRLERAAAAHAILAGIHTEPWIAGGSLYRTSPIAKSATTLLTGQIEGQAAEPVAWVFENEYGGRSFYTSLGHVDDFSNPLFQKILLNSVYWAADVTTSRQLQPGKNVSSLKIPNNLEMDLLLAEPTIGNPLYINFDERGRLWLVQYRQYPWPAGLKLVSRDNVWRNVYEPPFPPPPPHDLESPFRGSDRITIHEDTNGDGQLDRHTTFLDGLNLATAALRGRGGVFVMNPPYLLFYADRNNDDVPDSEQPRILLSGFGIEDTHSIANSLRWGPDGWIYGAHGSTVSASIVRHDADGKILPDQVPVHSMGQHIWRYHPETQRFEIFAEGGGNAFGVEFDSKGRLYSGHNGGDTRGFHYVQGGFSLKNFGKHGSLSNPYAFGYYDAMKHHSVERFTHTFEIYEADLLPTEYRGNLFGVSPNLHYLIESRIFAHGSSRQTKDIAKVIVPADGERDHWFTPVDIQTGPDGALYLADWYSVQANHYRNHEGQTNPDLGRVYRLRGPRSATIPRIDLGGEPSSVLVHQYLSHPNRWYRETALRILGDRRDHSVVESLRGILTDAANPDALDALWALNLCGGLDETFAMQMLDHADPFVRAWTVRLMGDKQHVKSETARRLAELASTEPDAEVRLQLACSSRRLPTLQALPILSSLLKHHQDATDVMIPNMIWWSVESHANDRQQILNWLKIHEHWASPLAISANLTENLMRRYAMQGSQIDLETCGKLLNLSPDAAHTERLLNGFTKAFAGRVVPPLPGELVAALSGVKGHYAVVLGIRRHDPGAVRKALQQLNDASLSQDMCLQYVRALGEVQADPQNCIPVLIGLLTSAKDDLVTTATLVALQRFDHESTATAILEAYPGLTPVSRETAVSVLASRSVWAHQLIGAIESGHISRADISQDTIERLRWHTDPALRVQVAREFPLASTTNQHLENRIDLVEKIVRQGNGDPLTGQQLFHQQANCGKCHRIFGRGGDVGPDLTAYNRTNVRSMLLSVINPSAEIREGYENMTVATLDGQVITGFKIDENHRVLVIRSADGQSHAIEKTDIDEQKPNKLSVMPTGSLDGLTDDQIRDLFAFLTSTTPPK